MNLTILELFNGILAVSCPILIMFLTSVWVLRNGDELDIAFEVLLLGMYSITII